MTKLYAVTCFSASHINADIVTMNSLILKNIFVVVEREGTTIACCVVPLLRG